MRRVLLLAVAALAGCGRSGIHDEKVRSWNGLSVQLTLLDPSPAVGAPLRIRLTLTHSGATPVFYDGQGLGRDVFDVRDASDRQVPYFGWRAQTFGSDKELPPGGAIVLLEEADLATTYLLGSV